jgi:HEAT repeat protein
MSDKAIDQIIELSASTSPQDRALAMKIIGKYRHLGMIDYCFIAIKDMNKEVREFAAWALDRLSSPDAVPALLFAMYDPVFGVRSNAGWALVNIARRTLPQVVVPDVIDVLESENEDAQQMAYLVLHHIGGTEAQAAIRRYWRR